MIGTEKPGEIRARLRKSLKKSDSELLAWFNEQVEKVRETNKRARCEIESLQLLRDALVAREQSKGKRQSAMRKRKTG